MLRLPAKTCIDFKYVLKCFYLCYVSKYIILMYSHIWIIMFHQPIIYQISESILHCIFIILYKCSKKILKQPCTVMKNAKTWLYTKIFQRNAYFIAHLWIKILSVLNYTAFGAQNAQCLYLRIKICMTVMLNSWKGG